MADFPSRSQIVVTCNDVITNTWLKCIKSITIRIMGRHLSETTRLLAWRYANIVFAVLALISAAATMAVPGPAGDLTGFSTVLLVGGLALLAGHAWGILVIAAAEVLIVGEVYPIVTNMISTHPVDSVGVATSLVAIVTALPGLVLFAATLPYTVEVVIGEKGSRAQKPAEILTGFAATFWVLQPILL